MVAEVMTVNVVAHYLRINPQTVYRRAEAGELPAIRIGRTLRFKRDLLDEWLRLTATSWSARRQRALYARCERTAKRYGLRERDVLRAVRARRYTSSRHR
ncbi:MAG: helix-turn-helix domain-containing protein [Candidatus Omnitrophica bacterium]|nr:helix-turn-helix domain-containing protein [Candidatus Omnitrophota bacterium]